MIVTRFTLGFCRFAWLLRRVVRGRESQVGTLTAGAGVSALAPAGCMWLCLRGLAAQEGFKSGLILDDQSGTFKLGKVLGLKFAECARHGLP